MKRKYEVMAAGLLSVIMAASLACAAVAAEEGTKGVSWTGTEWDGSREGEFPGRNCDIVQIGREAAHVDSVPYDTLDKAIRGAVDYEKKLSEYYQLLSKTNWKFTLVDSPSLFDESGYTAFYEPSFDDSAWDEIFVPSVWQTEGYDHPAYANINQKFKENFGNVGAGNPADLPAAPTIYNPVGLYRYSFELPAEWDGSRILLNFEGVDSAFYLWVNGIQAGYAEDSFTADTFDITEYVKPGETNTIAVKVYRWSDGSWIEDQDFFDLSGIFRDVYVYAVPEVRLRDYQIITDFDDTYTDSTMTVKLNLANQSAEDAVSEITVHLFDGEGSEVALEDNVITTSLAAGEKTGAQISVAVKEPRKWSAEDPYLYTVVLEEKTPQGTVFESYQTGFRKITYKTTESGWFEGTADQGDLIRINGEPLSLRGVNRHETHPEFGYAVPREVMEEDIRIMKEYNINAVRTSHYPNSPYLYYLCDKYGIYMIDEANQECHSNQTDNNELLTEYMSNALIDREYNLIGRDKNHASVVIWSLGNESGAPEILQTILVQEYPDQENVPQILHAVDPTRPWHYEQLAENFESGIDMKSTMYAGVEAMIAYGESGNPVPYIQCEYEHAMGNSEGNFDEYWAAIDSYTNLQGAFIWDFIDQSIYQTSEDGVQFYGYGGDFGEVTNDTNFCMNGLLFPDRTPQPEIEEVKYHYQQIKFKDAAAGEGQILLENYFLFTDIAEMYDFSWELLQDDTVIDSGILAPEEVAAPNMDPQTNMPGTKELTIPFSLENAKDIPGAEYFLNLSVTLKEEEPLLPAGHEIAKEQFILDLAADEEMPAPAEVKTISLEEDADALVLSGEGFRLGFDRSTGKITSYQAMNAAGEWKDLIVENAGPAGSFYRACIDNDKVFGWYGLAVQISAWKVPGDMQVVSCDVDSSEEGVVRISVEGLYPDLNNMAFNTEYTVYGTGQVAVDVQMIPQYNQQFVYLPVAGMQLTVPGEYEKLEFFGRGPGENYADRCAGYKVGRYATTVTDNFIPYVEPSETGNRTGVRWASLTNDEGFGLVAVAKGEPVEMSALHYTPEELNRVDHTYQLEPIEDTIFRLNAVQIGIGGDNSWFPLIVHAQYLTNAPEYTYSYILSPVLEGQDAMAICQEARLLG